MRRAFVTLLACALTAAPASAAEFTKKALEFDVSTGPTGETPCRIVADLYTPEGATKANPAAAMLATNGFGGSKNDFGTLGASYARRGYVFLAYSGLGFGGSGCKITIDDPDWDGRAGSQLVSFLGGSKAAVDGTKIDYVIKDKIAADGAQRDDDPRVGMIGGSYGGQIQFAIAGLDPRVDALNPQITWNDLSYSLSGNHADVERGVTTTTPGVAKLDWPVFFFGLGVGQGVAAALQGDTTKVGICPNYPDDVCTALLKSASLGYPDAPTTAFLQHASVVSYMSKIRIPTLLAQGLSDTLFNINEAVATYTALRNQGTPVKMLWRSSGHSGGGVTGESSAGNPESAYESRAALEWFDYYLRGVGDSPELDFTFFRDWVKYDGDAIPAIGQTPNYPAGVDVPFYLSGTNALVTAKGDVSSGSAAFLAGPLSTGGSGASIIQVPFQDDLPGTFTSFETPPLTEDLDVVGIPTLTVKLDAPTFAGAQSLDPASKLVLFVKLFDVDGGGTVKLPRDIFASARVGDVGKPVKIELPGISHRFAKGHRVRVVIASGNLLRKGNYGAGPVTVVNDPANPNVLALPRLGRQSGAAGTGPGGATAFVGADGAAFVQRPAPRPANTRRPAATLPSVTSLRSCTSRQRLSIRLRKASAGDQLRTATITVNGRVAKSVRGRALRNAITLRKLPKGTFRVVVTVRTAKGRTLRSARTYRKCVAKKKTSAKEA